MADSTSNTVFSFVTIFTLIFITLKLTGIIHWNWWWVLSPVLLPFLIITGMFILFVIYLDIYIPLFSKKK